MGTYGVTPQGFVVKPLSQVSSEVDTGLQVIIGKSAGTNPDGTIPAGTFAGQLKALIVDGLSAQWSLQQAVYASRDPTQANDASLDAVCALTGTVRNGFRFSVDTVACIGVPLTVLPVGRVVTVTGTNARFLSTAAGTIAAVAAWAALTAYVVGNRVTLGGNVYQCTIAGNSAASGGPTGTGSAIADGSVTWKYLGAGTGAVDIVFQADTAGAIGATAGTLATIATPVSGWNAAINILDAVIGALTESNSALRTRRNAQLAAGGKSTAPAIRANILKVNQGSTDPNHAAPTTCNVFLNNTDFTDVNGVPPHSCEVLVQGGTDADIALAVWNNVGAGTATYGTTTSIITDSQGNSQTVKWSRPTAVPIYVTATLYYDASQWPAGSDALVGQAALSALMTYGSTYPIGHYVRTSSLIAAMLRGPAQTSALGLAVIPADPASAPIAGGVEVNPIYIGLAANPTGTSQIAITVRQVASFDSSRCVINATSETP